MTMNTFITLLFYAVAICHCLSSKVIAPFLKAIFVELTEPTADSTGVLPVLVVAAPVKAPSTKAPAKPRPARRRKSSTMVAA